MRHSSRTIRATAHVAALTVTIGGLAACQGSEQPRNDPASAGLGHVHGIGVNPADKTIYIASHNGVFRVSDGRATLIADRKQDTMGFTIAGPDDFLASGHPAPGSDTPNPLGLIGSKDGADSWTTLSYGGQADFHSIDAVGGYVYAYGGDQLLMSQNRKSWKPILQAPLIDFAADPRSPRQLLATTASGQVIAFAVGEDPKSIASAPPLAFIDRTTDGNIVGVDPAGQIFVSEDEGTTWDSRAKLAGSPQALSVRADAWYAATETGVFESADEGDTWQPLVKVTS